MATTEYSTGTIQVLTSAAAVGLSVGASELSLSHLLSGIALVAYDKQKGFGAAKDDEWLFAGAIIPESVVKCENQLQSASPQAASTGKTKMPVYGDLKLDANTTKILDNAERICRESGNHTVEPGHVLCALVTSSDSAVHDLLVGHNIDVTHAAGICRTHFTREKPQ